jgi:mucin-19
MALVLADRVLETTTTTGSGTITLAGAEPGYQSFSAVGNGNQTYYTITADTVWEVGIGTYTASGTTLSRDTVLSSSASGAKVTLPSGVKKVFVTYPSEKSVNLDVSGNISLSSAVISGVGYPSANSDAATKLYVDTLAAEGISYHTPVKYEVPDTTGNLNATYNNGTAGVSATLTNAGTLGPFVPDGVTASISDRILIYNQTNAVQNGVYVVTTVGTGASSWVLTRAADANTYGVKSPTALGTGDAFYVTSGNTGAGETYVCNTPGTIVFGSTNITFVQVSAAQVYQAGTGISLTNTTISLVSPVVVATGGTGLTSTPTNGQLLIGNGSGYTLSTLTAGSGVSITNSAGSITLTATGTGGTVVAVTASAPLASTGGVSPNISIANSTGTGSVVLDQGATISSATITAGVSAAITTITGTSANITTVTGTTAGFSSAAITQLSGTSAGITTVSGTTTTFSSGTITQFGATSATITTLSGTNVTYPNANFTSASITNLALTSLTLANLSITSANITTLTGSSMNVTTATHASANITTINGTSADITTITGTTIGTTASATIRGISGAITTISGTTATYTSATVTNLALTSLTITSLSITNLAASSATITTGNLAFTGTAQRITGDFSNATIASRLMFQTSTANSNTAVENIPSGTATTTRWTAYNNSDPTNASFLQFGITGTTEAVINSGVRGTGTYVPITFQTNGSERMRLDTSGRLLIGSTTARANLFNSTNTSPLQVEGTSFDTSSILAVRNENNSSASALVLGKTRGTTVGSTTVVANGDGLGLISFQGSDGTEFVEAARIQALVDGDPGANDMPGRLIFSTTADGAAAVTERMRIDSSGNVGIGGTANSFAKVEIAGNFPGTTGGIAHYVNATAPSNLTSNFQGFRTAIGTAAASFNLTNGYHFYAAQGTFGAGSTVTNQYGFHADSSLIGATNNFGFYSNIASGSNRWNFYAAGTAQNYFEGNVGIGKSPTTKLDVSGTITGTAVSVTDGTFTSATVTNLNSTSANITTLTGTTFGTTATTNLRGLSAQITTATITSANITTITGTTLGTFTSGTVTNLNSTSANITTLTGTTFGTTATTQLRGASGAITTLTGTTFGTTTGTTVNAFTVNVSTTGTTINSNGDIYAMRTGGASGVIYLGNSGARYLYYDGANYAMPGANLFVNGIQVVTNSGTWGISITGNAATVTTGMPNNTDNYMNFRVMRNSNTVSPADGMYIGYGNTAGGATRIYGAGSTSGHAYIDASGNWFRSDGVVYIRSDNISSYATGSSLKSQTFTGSGTFTVPSGITSVWVTMIGGGSGGAGDSSGNGAGGGGAGAFCIKRAVSVTAGAGVTVTIGGGGAGGASSIGSDGSATSFGSVSVSGANAGGYIGNASNTLAGNGGAAGNSRQYQFPAGSLGGKGGTTWTSGGVTWAGGAGGLYGNGGNSGTSANAGSAADANSGGGGGGGNGGGAGGSGIVIVEWMA